MKPTTQSQYWILRQKHRSNCDDDSCDDGGRMRAFVRRPVKVRIVTDLGDRTIKESLHFARGHIYIEEKEQKKTKIIINALHAFAS